MYREMVIYEPPTRATQGDRDNALLFNINEDQYERIKKILEENYIFEKIEDRPIIIKK